MEKKNLKSGLSIYIHKLLSPFIGIICNFIKKFTIITRKCSKTIFKFINY